MASTDTVKSEWTKEIPESSFSQADFLRVRNFLVQILEEIKLRRRTDIENEDRIKHLVKEKHQLECKHDAEVSKVSNLQQKHKEEIREIHRQYADKVRLMQEEKSRQKIVEETVQKETSGLKDDVRNLQLQKYSLEKQLHEQTNKLHLQMGTAEKYLSQLSALEHKFTNVARQYQQVIASQGRLEKNVEESITLNRSLTYINHHQKCLVEQYSKDLDGTKQELLATRVQMQSEPAETSQKLHDLEVQVKHLETKVKQEQDKLDQKTKEYLEMETIYQKCQEQLQEDHKLLEGHLAVAKQYRSDCKTLEAKLESQDTELKNLKAELQDKNLTLETEMESIRVKESEWKSQEENFTSKMSELKKDLEETILSRDNLEELNTDWAQKNLQVTEELAKLQAIVNVEKKEGWSQTELSVSSSSTQVDHLNVTVKESQTTEVLTLNSSSQTKMTLTCVTESQTDCSEVKSAETQDCLCCNQCKPLALNQSETDPCKTIQDQTTSKSQTVTSSIEDTLKKGNLSEKPVTELSTPETPDHSLTESRTHLNKKDNSIPLSRPSQTASEPLNRIKSVLPPSSICNKSPHSGAESTLTLNTVVADKCSSGLQSQQNKSPTVTISSTKTSLPMRSQSSTANRKDDLVKECIQKTETVGSFEATRSSLPSSQSSPANRKDDLVKECIQKTETVGSFEATRSSLPSLLISNDSLSNSLKPSHTSVLAVPSSSLNPDSTLCRTKSANLSQKNNANLAPTVKTFEAVENSLANSKSPPSVLKSPKSSETFAKPGLFNLDNSFQPSPKSSKTTLSKTYSPRSSSVSLESISAGKSSKMSRPCQLGANDAKHDIPSAPKISRKESKVSPKSGSRFLTSKPELNVPSRNSENFYQDDPSSQLELSPYSRFSSQLKQSSQESRCLSSLSQIQNFDVPSTPTSQYSTVEKKEHEALVIPKGILKDLSCFEKRSPKTVHFGGAHTSSPPKLSDTNDGESSLFSDNEDDPIELGSQMKSIQAILNSDSTKPSVRKRKRP